MQKNIFKKESGYTILETMIAISLFIVIVMAGMGALLNANLLSKKSQSMRSILDNLSFVMEDMGRNMRTGSNYDCIVSGSVPGVAVPTSGQSCGGVAFKPGSGGNVWGYYIGAHLKNPSNYSIFKVVDGVTVQLTPDEVSINPISGFSVLGAEPPTSGDMQQPFVTIRLVGTIILNSTTSTPFSLQTSVSQRLIDL